MHNGFWNFGLGDCVVEVLFTEERLEKKGSILGERVSGCTVHKARLITNIFLTDLKEMFGELALRNSISKTQSSFQVFEYTMSDVLISDPVDQVSEDKGRILIYSNYRYDQTKESK